VKRISPLKKVGLLGALYFVQGLPFGFQSTALPVYLRTQGVSLKVIGFLGALALPWVLKVLWAPLVDRYSSARIGRRKSWILPMQALLAATCVAAALVVERGVLSLLLGLIFLMNLFAATQDIAVDGLAVKLLEPWELGAGNTAQVVGYKLGMLTGGGLLVWATAHIGWRGLFLAMALLSLVVLAVTAMMREPVSTEEAAGRMSWREIFDRLRAAVSLRGAGWLLLFIGTYKLGESMVDVLFKPFLVDAGITPAQIGLWVGTWGTVASVLGSVAGGLLASRMPLLGALALTASLRVFPLGGEWLRALHGPTEGGVIAVTVAENFLGGMLTTAMFAFMMSRVDRRIGATHYTLLASVEVLGKAPGGPIAGLLATDAGWSYANVFLLGMVLSVAFVVLLLPLRQRTAPLPPAVSPGV
jgi:MFS transporter, PAT family, beta-lactamase induction signal transducer AmpG